MKSFFAPIFTLAITLTSCAHVKPLDLGGSHKGTLLYRFSVKSCDPHLTLPPATASDPTWTATARDSRTHHCQGFTIYDLKEAAQDLEYTAYIRTEKAEGCTSQISVAAKHHCSHEDPKACIDKSHGQEAAERLLKLIGTSSSSMDQLDVFDSYDDFTKWCRKRVRQKVYAREHLTE